VTSGPTTRAELYDPAAASSTATGDMIQPRAGHSATLLPDGRVLIAGGCCAEAELYNPDTGTFTSTGHMPPPGNLATLLANGKLLLIWGSDAQLYDPVTGLFIASGTYTLTRNSGPPRAALLPDGRVFVEQCLGQNCTFQLYDPDSGRFTDPGTFGLIGPYIQFVDTATFLADGKALLVAVDDSDVGELSVPAEVYDAAAGTFTRVGAAIAPRELSTATLMPDGTVLVNLASTLNR
jgi:hypothetical protein